MRAKHNLGGPAVKKADGDAGETPKKAGGKRKGAAAKEKEVNGDADGAESPVAAKKARKGLAAVKEEEGDEEGV